MISSDDPAHILNAFVQGMHLSEMNAAYDRTPKISQHSTAFQDNDLYLHKPPVFSPEIEAVYRIGIHFRYLLEDIPTSDHTTVALFHELI